jgi:hypothetical protein
VNARLRGEIQVTGDDPLLSFGGESANAEVGRYLTFMHVPIDGQRRVLCMLRHYPSEEGDPVHRFLQDVTSSNAVAVVAEDPDTGLPKLLHRTHLGTGATGRERRGGRQFDQSNRATALDHRPDERGPIGGRIGIRHGHNRGETAGCRCPGSGLDVFFPRLTWFAEVHMDIDEPWTDVGACAVDYLATGLTGTDERYSVALDSDVCDQQAGGRHDGAPAQRDHRPTPRLASRFTVVIARPIARFLPDDPGRR